jgi:hypothetical protein
MIRCYLLILNPPEVCSIPQQVGIRYKHSVLHFQPSRNCLHARRLSQCDVSQGLKDRGFHHCATAVLFCRWKSSTTRSRPALFDDHMHGWNITYYCCMTTPSKSFLSLDTVMTCHFCAGPRCHNRAAGTLAGPTQTPQVRRSSSTGSSSRARGGPGTAGCCCCCTCCCTVGTATVAGQRRCGCSATYVSDVCVCLRWHAERCCCCMLHAAVAGSRCLHILHQP